MQGTKHPFMSGEGQRLGSFLFLHLQTPADFQTSLLPLQSEYPKVYSIGQIILQQSEEVSLLLLCQASKPKTIQSLQPERWPCIIIRN